MCMGKGTFDFSVCLCGLALCAFVPPGLVPLHSGDLSECHVAKQLWRALGQHSHVLWLRQGKMFRTAAVCRPITEVARRHYLHGQDFFKGARDAKGQESKPKPAKVVHSADGYRWHCPGNLLLPPTLKHHTGQEEHNLERIQTFCFFLNPYSTNTLSRPDAKQCPCCTGP